MDVWGQLVRAQLEFRTANPSAALPGRIWWNSTDGKAYLDDATTVRAFLRNDANLVIGNNGTAANNIRLNRSAAAVLQVLPGNDATAEGSAATSLAQLGARVENYTFAGLPTFGNGGRLAYATDQAKLYLDTVTAWTEVPLAGTSPYTQFSFTNGQASPANVTGFLVNGATNNGFVADFTILRQMTNVSPVGDLDTTFVTAISTGFNSAVQGLAVIATDSSIIVGGAFTSFNGTSINRIAKLSAAGAEDTTFTANIGTGLNDTVRAIAIDSTDRIFAGGSFGTFNGNARSQLVCMSSAGVEDGTFYTNLGSKFPAGPANVITGLAIQADDKIVAAGGFPTFNGGAPAYIVRLNSDGTEDGTFSTNVGAGFDAGSTVAVIQSADQKILIGGSFTTLAGGGVAQGLVRLNTDGTLDGAFNTNLGTGFDQVVTSIAVQADGKIIVAGGFNNFNGNARNYIVRLNSDGTEDGTFYTNLGTGFDASILSVHVQNDGKILVSGNFTAFDGNNVEKTARINSDGTEDTDFSALTGPTQTGIIADRCIVAKPNGAVLMGGSVTSYNNIVTKRLIQLDVVEELNQAGTFYGAYSNLTSAWRLSTPVGAFDDAGLVFSITAGGQLQYTSTTLLGTSVTQLLRFQIRGM